MKYRGIRYEKSSAGSENVREAAGIYRGALWQRQTATDSSARSAGANLSYRGVGYHIR